LGISTVSAGGILLRQEADSILVVIVEREKGIEKKWTPILRQLPKGGCREGETLRETALREVLEETGFSAKILRKAGKAHWSYIRNGQEWNETVHYFLMQPLGKQQEHDEEFETVSWVKIEDAAKLLSYPEERNLLSYIIEIGKYPLG
jgi:8-oxo-(d)GTP phosphatase